MKAPKLRTVSTQIREPIPTFNAFYEDNSILIQFIVEEFTRTHHFISQIKTLFDGQLECHTRFSPQSFITILGQLIASPQQPNHPSISRWTQGPLTKFKEYCEQFSRNSLHENKYHVNLHMAAHQTWLMAVYSIELLSSLYTSPNTPDAQFSLFLHPIKRSFHTLHMRFSQVYRIIPRILHEYADDENVIYYLMRSKEALAHIYEEDFLYKQFKWSKKPSELIDLLLSRYQIRGFKTQLCTIKDLL